MFYFKAEANTKKAKPQILTSVRLKKHTGRYANTPLTTFLSILSMLFLAAISATYVFAVTHWLATREQPIISCQFTTTALIIGSLILIGLTPLGAIPAAILERLNKQSLRQIFSRPHPECVSIITSKWEEACRITGQKFKCRIIRLDSQFPWVVGKTVYVPDSFADNYTEVIRDVLIHEIGHIALGHTKIHVLVNALCLAPRCISFFIGILCVLLRVFAQAHLLIFIMVWPIYFALTLADEILTIAQDAMIEFTSRRNEHIADEYAVRHGVWDGLRMYLEDNKCGETRSHPATWKRLQRMRVVRDSMLV